MTDETTDQLDRLEQTARDLQKLMHQNRSIGNATINASVNAGGVGIWIAVTCCCVMLSCIVIGSLWATREMARFDQEMQARKDENSKMSAYLSAIYVQAPQLKPKSTKDKE
jgi:hypothetical protein